MEIIMALLDAVKGLFGGQKNNTGKKLYIVDADSLEKSSQKQMPPHQQINILKQLAQFADKEKVNIHALLDGKPLRVVADGADFSGITVFFTRNKLSMEELTRKRVKAVRRSAPILISSNQKLESVVEAIGGQWMSNGTFKKALGIGESKPGGRERRRPQGASSKKSGSRRNSGNNPPRKKVGSGKKKPSETEHVQNLIDLVD